MYPPPMRRRPKHPHRIILVDLRIHMIRHLPKPFERTRRSEHHSSRDERRARDPDGEGEVVERGCGGDEVVWEV